MLWTGFRVKPGMTIALVVLGGACAARQVPSGSLEPRQGVIPPAIESREVGSDAPPLDAKQLAAWNKAAKRPTFGLIHAFYQLPQLPAVSAIEIREGVSWASAYRSVIIEQRQRDYFAVLPVSPREAEVLSGAMQTFLDAGIRFVDVTAADANRIMKAEQEAIRSDKWGVFTRSLPSGVDVLISIQRGQGETGPVFIGRVIRTSDGRLLALRSTTDAGTYSLQPLVQQLVTDSLRRLAEVK